jgi:hypothetical protein
LLLYAEEKDIQRIILNIKPAFHNS